MGALKTLVSSVLEMNPCQMTLVPLHWCVYVFGACQQDWVGGESMASWDHCIVTISVIILGDRAMS